MLFPLAPSCHCPDLFSQIFHFYLHLCSFPIIPAVPKGPRLNRQNTRRVGRQLVSAHTLLIPPCHSPLLATNMFGDSGIRLSISELWKKYCTCFHGFVIVPYFTLIELKCHFQTRLGPPKAFVVCHK